MRSWLFPGLFASGLLLIVALLSFGTLWFNAPSGEIASIIADDYLWHVVRFTFWQAFLSALFSILPAIWLAKALFRRQFLGKILFLRLCAMSLVLPVLVALFGILTVYGRAGWIAQICEWIGIDYQFTPYGLQGILLAHIFFNMPLATRMLLQALESISPEQRQLASQLGMNGWQRFRFLELPYLWRQILPTAALIFMLCFASFATVLALGGGPAATTVELAIYQALSYDYDLHRAALLALIQLSCCLGLVLISQKLNGTLFVGHSQQMQWRDPSDPLFAKIADVFIITMAILFLVPPILAVITDGMNSQFIRVIQQPVLWQAFRTSLVIALGAGVVCVVLTMMLLWSSRELRLRHFSRAGQAMEMSGLIILAMPGIVLATGFFLLLNNTIGLPESPYILVILTNALMAIPYALKVLENPMNDIASRYSLLCQSLNLHGVNRLRWIELRALKKPLSQALAFACVISIGDFGIVALFGNETFRTLPFYLYQQIGAYHTQDGAITAMILLLLCFSLFSLLERIPGKSHD